MIRTSCFLLLAIALLAPALPADDGWVGNRGGATVARFDTAANIELSGSPISVGTTPVAIAQNNADGADPGRIYVLNRDSNDISVIDRETLTVQQTITGVGSAFGTFTTPTAMIRAANSTLGPMLVVVDSKMVSGGRSTVRFLDPSNGVFLDEFNDMSASALYLDVAFDPNLGRLWITDAGDQGVTVLKLGALGGPPFSAGPAIVFAGAGEFADFVFDPASTPTYMVSPQRAAVSPDGNYVVVTDAGSAFVTVIDADYAAEPANGDEPVVAKVSVASLPGAPTATRGVVIVGTKAYVTTNVTGEGCVGVIELTGVTNGTVPTTITSMSGSADGIAATTDGSKIYVGEATAGTQIRQIDPTSDTLIQVFTLTSGLLYPQAMLFTGSNVGSGAITPGFDGSNHDSGGGSCHGGGADGGAGFAAFILLLVVFALRQAYILRA